MWHANSHDFFALLLGEVQTTNPSSLALALMGIVTFLCYQILARPGHEHRKALPRGQAFAKPKAAAEASPREERRVA